MKNHEEKWYFLRFIWIFTLKFDIFYRKFQFLPSKSLKCFKKVIFTFKIGYFLLKFWFLPYKFDIIPWKIQFYLKNLIFIFFLINIFFNFFFHYFDIFSSKKSKNFIWKKCTKMLLSRWNEIDFCILSRYMPFFGVKMEHKKNDFWDFHLLTGKKIKKIGFLAFSNDKFEKIFFSVFRVFRRGAFIFENFL